MSDVFTAYAYDLNTNTRLCQIPLTKQDTFGRRLNGAGPLSLQVPLRQSVVSYGQATPVSTILSSLLAYDGVPVKVYIDRDGIITAAYIAWTGDYQNSTGILRIGGMELISYFAARVILADYGPKTYSLGLDPAVLLYKVLTDTQNVSLGGAGASIGLNVVNNSVGLPFIDAGYPISQRTTVQQIIRDMTALLTPGIGGLDLSVTSAWDPISGNPVDTVTLVTPRAGRPAGQTGLIFNLDQAMDFWWSTDAQKSGTNILATGSGTGSKMPVSFIPSPGVPVGGLGQSPRLDKAISTPSTSTAQNLKFANFAASQYGRPVATPIVQVPTSYAPQPFGSWIMGDDARLYTPGNARFPNGKDEYWRIVSDDVTIPSEGVPFVKVTFNLPPTY